MVEARGFESPCSYIVPPGCSTDETERIYSMRLYLCVAVNFICDHPAIKAISFVGSNSAGEYIYERGSKNGKRVQSNMVHQNLQYFLFILTT